MVLRWEVIRPVRPTATQYSHKHMLVCLSVCLSVSPPSPPPFSLYPSFSLSCTNTYVTLHHGMSRNALSLFFAVGRNLLQGCEKVDFVILVVTA